MRRLLRHREQNAHLYLSVNQSAFFRHSPSLVVEPVSTPSPEAVAAASPDAGSGAAAPVRFWPAVGPAPPPAPQALLAVALWAAVAVTASAAERQGLAPADVWRRWAFAALQAVAAYGSLVGPSVPGGPVQALIAALLPRP